LKAAASRPDDGMHVSSGNLAALGGLFCTSLTARTDVQHFCLIQYFDL
jgi:hypothetical protein